MKHEDRRKELGKVLMDIGKYLATVGLIGNFLTSTLTIQSSIFIIIVVILIMTIGFYTIPPK
ncbi:MAG: hypothetical protein AB1498_05820 [bacterium]